MTRGAGFTFDSKGVSELAAFARVKLAPSPPPPPPSSDPRVRDHR